MRSASVCSLLRFNFWSCRRCLRCTSRPILFNVYTVDLQDIVAAYGLSCHLYYDDSQSKPDLWLMPLRQLLAAVSDRSTANADWMGSNCLQLNTDKTEVTWCASAPVIIAVVAVDPVSTVRNLGVLMDADLGSVWHTRLVVPRCFAALRQLRRYVTDDCFRSLVAALVHARFVYGEFILVGSPAYRLRLLQSVLNAAARLTLPLRRYDHVTDVLVVLHWLRVPERIVFRLAEVAVTTYRVLYGAAPS
jgi:hypothetical protein